MEVVSDLVEIPNNKKPSTEYVLSELSKLGITPLRWAIVKVTDEKYTISAAILKEQEG